MRTFKTLCVCALIVLAFGAYGAPSESASAAASKQSHAPQQKTQTMTKRASGTFQVKLVPQPPEQHADSRLGRMTIDKTFSGDLEGTSKGQMLSAMTATKGSAGYVAIEHVTGKLHGRSGSFVLQHSGTMDRGAQSLTITVVPDSGTGELTGLTGSMKIIIEGGKHSYEFDYEVKES